MAVFTIFFSSWCVLFKELEQLIIYISTIVIKSDITLDATQPEVTALEKNSQFLGYL